MVIDLQAVGEDEDSERERRFSINDKGMNCNAVSTRSSALGVSIDKTKFELRYIRHSI